MKRSSSWKNLQKTFASTPINVPKRAKHTRTKVIKNEFIRRLDDSIDFQIEDSDEENNVSSATPSSTPKQRHISRRLVKPLLINTSLNSSIVNNSFACDSDESLSGEPELRDVSELQSVPRYCKARNKSLVFLTESAKNQKNSQQPPQINTPKDVTPLKEKTRNLRSTFNSRANNQSRDENADITVIESDSSNESYSPIKSASISKRKTLSTDIVFTQSSESQNVIIESQSSQFSLKFDSPIQPLPSKRSKCRKQIKGGLVERLNKVLNHTKSDYSFWMNERTSNLIEPGIKMRINQMESNYGRILLHCSNVSDPIDENLVNILCIDPTFKRLPLLQIGKIIEIGIDCCVYATGKNTRFYPQVSKILV